MRTVRITVEIVHHVVVVELEAGAVDRRRFELVYDDVFNRIDQLIDADMVRWMKSRPDHFIVMPQRDVAPVELAAEIKKRLRL
jgi:hypothetical protein